MTIASTGNATFFGDLTISGRRGGACSSPTRGVWGGNCKAADDLSNIIDYVEFATLGDAVDFGDLSVTRGQCSGFSNAHGGL